MPAVAPDPIGPNRIRLDGHGLTVAGPAGAPIRLGDVEGDVLDLTPADPLTLEPGGFEVQLRRATVEVPLTALAALVRERVPDARDVVVTPRPPDGLRVTGRQQGQPFRLEGRLGAAGGKLVFEPLHVEGTLDGVQAVADPAAGTLALAMGSQTLLARLAPVLPALHVSEPTLALRADGSAAFAAHVRVAGRPATLEARLTLAPAPDGRLALRPLTLAIRQEGLTIDAEPAAGKAHVEADTATMTRALAHALGGKQVRKLALSFQPGNRVGLTAEVFERGGWRPITLTGHLDARQGKLRLLAEHVTAKGVAGGVDVELDPRSARGTAVIPERALNAIIQPMLAKGGFSRGQLKLTAGGGFQFTAQRRDPQAPGGVSPVLVRGRMALVDGALRLEPDFVKAGSRELDMHGAMAGFAHFFGWSLASELKLDAPFARVEGDTIVVRPDRFPPPLGAHVERARVESGRLVLTGRFPQALKGFGPKDLQLRDGALELDAGTLAPGMRGQVTGVKTHAGGLGLDLKPAPGDWLRALGPLPAGLQLHGDEVRADVGKLLDMPGAKVTAAAIGQDQARLTLAGDPRSLDAWAPKVPGVSVAGARWTVDLAAAGLRADAPLTAVQVGPEGLRVQVGEPRPAGVGSRLEGRVAGDLAIAGVVLHDAVVSVAAARPLDPTADRLPVGAKIVLQRGRATIPNARVTELIRQVLPDQGSGLALSWRDGHLAVGGRWLGLPFRGSLAPQAAGDRGLVLVPQGFHWGPFPLPRWLAARAVARQVGGTRAGGQVFVTPRWEKLEAGRVTAIQPGRDAVEVTIG